MKRYLGYILCAAIFLWMILSTIEVWIHNANGNNYHHANLWVLISSHTTDMVVVDCQGYYTDDYEVVVEDIKGNQYAYIDSEPKANGSIIRITISGTEIINAK